MPSRTPPSPRVCPAARSLDLLGDRWSLLVLREVLYGQKRFEGIHHFTGAPRDILAERLKRLTEAGLLEKKPYNESGTRFEYVATAKGQATRPILTALAEFGDDALPGPASRWRDLFEIDADE